MICVVAIGIEDMCGGYMYRDRDYVWRHRCGRYRYKGLVCRLQV